MRKVISILVFLIFSILSFAQETGPILCSDGIDNDGNGLIDCEESSCFQLPNNGCLRCGEGISFADSIIELSHGCPETDATPDGILGLANWDLAPPEIPEFFFLGSGGFVKLGFTNNLLINSGNDESDLWVFEVGEAIEPSLIAVRPLDDFTVNALQDAGIPDVNGDGFYEVGGVGGSTTLFDLDEVIQGYEFGELRFDAVEIRDPGNGPCYPGTPGADIDAVCALFYLPVDCAGNTNGDYEFDECGICLLPSDSLFNQSCADCAGIPNGNAIIDFCGECHSIDDPNFNSSCNAFEKIYIPNIFSPNGDIVNDDFIIGSPEGLILGIEDIEIYSRWGELVFFSEDLPWDNEMILWDGKKNGQDVVSGIYAYRIVIRFQGDVMKKYDGTVTIIR